MSTFNHTQIMNRKAAPKAADMGVVAYANDCACIKSATGGGTK